MAKNTNPLLKNQMIYSIYVRNHTEEGTFRAIEPDLTRIRNLGTDVIWLMPIHPIGVEGKKGSLGCPYAISDYRKVNPAYGTMEDFIHLTEAIHAQGMKCMIDVVYNHTSHDSVLLKEHPEYFYRKPNGDFGNRCGEWADVYDLDYEQKELWDYQIDSLKMWAKYVDGFRCDVASCVPVEFWERARREVAEVRPDCIWLAESVHESMVLGCREMGLPVWSDNELYEAFDLEYQYDIIRYYDQYLSGEGSLVNYLDALNRQEAIYPENYIKLRYLENHDTHRICSRVTDPADRNHWLAFMYFQKGTMLVYAGQEYSNAHTPSLFEREPIDREGTDISKEIQNLSNLKKKLPAEAAFRVSAVEGEIVSAVYSSKGVISAFGAFALKGQKGSISVPISDGIYQNEMDQTMITVSDGKMDISENPVVILL